MPAKPCHDFANSVILLGMNHGSENVFVDTTVQVQRSPASRQPAALRLALAALSADERNSQIRTIVADLKSGRNSTDGLWDATRGGELVGAVWTYAMPGRQAIVWPPQLVATEPEATANEILNAALAALGERGVLIAQAVLPFDKDIGSERLGRVGFSHLAVLQFLVAEEDRFPRVVPATALEFVPVTASDLSQLGELIEATYIGTLDCPGLDNVRATSDVLAGYLATGVSQTEHWYFVRNGGANVGCLLLSSFPEHAQWELTYMGIVPAARGRGWGREIALQSQWFARRAGVAQVTLAVDEKNEPAKKLYAAAGFVPWEKRHAWFKLL